MRKIAEQPIFISAAIICLCFLLTSTGWLAWEYHLLEQVSSRLSDVMTMVVGYALQTAGMGVYALLLRRRGAAVNRALPAVLLLHTLCLIPAILGRSLAVTLLSGFLVNLLCGYIAGYYLFVLTRTVPAPRRGTALGAGYGVSILASWLLSRLGGGSIYYSNKVWLICLALTALTVALTQWEQTLCPEDPAPGNKRPAGENGAPRALLLSAGALVLLFSVVNNSGFAFSSGDLVKGISVESSRLFYAAGLLIAGLVSDRDRKYGAVMALFTLVIPFVMLSLRGESVSLTVFWALNYFTYGFYSVYRMLVFSDLAEKSGALFLSGFGLLMGRLGDAAGEGVCLALSDSLTALIFLAALLFMAVMLLFFRLYRPLYLPEGAPQQSERERFYQFAIQHDLSSREQDMLRLLLDRKTNAEIADALSISENTVKFHVRNLLQKTGCKNRNDLVTAYFGGAAV